jgi:hypothetical protein
VAEANGGGNADLRRPFSQEHQLEVAMAKGQIGSEALIPNPARAPLAPLVGEWRTAGTHPEIQGKTFHGRTSFAWQDGGAFLVMRSEIDEPEIPSGIAIFGSDNVEGLLFMLYFDERGISRKYDVTAGGMQIVWVRDDPKFSQRMTLSVDPGGKRIVSRGQMCRDGGEWTEDLSLIYVRADT